MVRREVRANAVADFPTRYARTERNDLACAIRAGNEVGMGAAEILILRNDDVAELRDSQGCERGQRREIGR